jgi:hypothetical protein
MEEGTWYDRVLGAQGRARDRFSTIFGRRADLDGMLNQTLAALSAALAAAGSAVASVSSESSSLSALSARLEMARAAVLQASQPGARDGGGVRVVKVSPDVVNAAVRHASLPHREPLDVILEIQQSARTASVFLSMGGRNIDLGTGSALTLRIGGTLGLRSLTFTSGTSVTNITAAINTFSDVTGVRATEIASSGSMTYGVFLQSLARGSAQFVSVHLVDDGGLVGQNVGFYRVSPGSEAVPDVSGFGLYPYPFAVQGQDVAARVNGAQEDAVGPVIQIRRPHLNMDVELAVGPAIESANAQTPGTMRAFILVPRRP